MKLPMRDDFHSTTKELLAKRVGYRCSNPSCRQSTSGPHKNPTKIINVGVAAHITAASPGGPRYDAFLSSEQRSSAQNGIWLCQKCAKLIDNDSIRYTFDVLLDWKQIAEKLAIHELECSNASSSNSVKVSEVLSYKRMEACQNLFCGVQKASTIVKRLFDTEELTIQDKQEIACVTGLKVAELAENTSFYIDREIIIHIVGTFVGLEDIFVVENSEIQQTEIDYFNENIRKTYEMLESVRDTGKLDKSINSSIIKYYRSLQKTQEHNNQNNDLE